MFVKKRIHIEKEVLCLESKYLVRLKNTKIKYTYYYFKYILLSIAFLVGINEIPVAKNKYSFFSV